MLCKSNCSKWVFAGSHDGDIDRCYPFTSIDFIIEISIDININLSIDININLSIDIDNYTTELH